MCNIMFHTPEATFAASSTECVTSDILKAYFFLYWNLVQALYSWFKMPPPAALLSFIAPNVLDSPNVFKRVYSDPISR